MKLKPKKLEIPEENPFTNDALERYRHVESLVNLVINTNPDDSFVLALNSIWGSGKTIFVKMWQAELKKEKCPNNIL